ncbi:MAG: ABC transporter ATP-binding protein [Planctomycetes bacterium]|nr:ABC transporter ATP-binding protein [Planctomycetota bacterium]
MAISNDDALVRVENIEKTYTRGSGRDATEVHVLAGLNFTIKKGDFVALMGPSGSGKTTLLNIIAGIDRPSLGSIAVDGLETTNLSESQLARWRSENVGFIFQLYNLIPVLTAAENVELPLLLTKLGKAKRREHVETALKIVGLGDRMHHYPRQLSGGQEQRVAIARAIVTDPLLILADEPTGDLDKVAGVEVLTLLKRLNAEFGKTILMVTHDPHAAESAKRIVHLEKGVLVRDDEVNSVR